MSLREVRIPDLGDATEVEVIEICVAVGQELEADDALIVIESDKASMEVPAPQAGVVVSIKSQLGDQVQTDDLILTMEVALEEEPSTVKVEEPAPQEQAPSDVPIVEQVAVTPEPIEEVGEVSEELLEVRVQDIGEAKDVVIIDILVKEGDDVEADDPLVVVESDKASMEIVAPAKGTIESLPVQLEQPIEEGTLVAVIRAMIVSKVDSPTTQTSEPTPQVPTPTPARPEPTETVQSPIRSLPDGKADSRHIYAGPAVRRLARELGVDLTKVNGSGSKGRITKDDVHAYVKAILTSGVQQGSLPEVKYPDFTKFGEVELQPMSRMRSVGAENLVRSWLNVVHVTQFDTTDVTDLEAKRKQLNEDSLAKGESTKLTPLPFIIRACALTLKAYPQFNASIHPSLTQLILKKYMHMGFAVDTDEGLIVPVIRDVLDKDLYELSNEVATLSDAARRRRLRPDQISGATFTISSLGRLGGTGFAPVVNAPEVGILGVARMETRPVWNGESFEPRSILPISLSYDHRAINGAEAGRFLQAVCQRIADVSDY